MPNCFVKNCKNRTSYLFNKNVKFYTFPHDPDLRLKWLEACQKNKEYKNKDERICEIHFKSNCFEERMTKPRSKKRVIRRLKKGSIPTELLNLPNEKHKRTYSFGKSYDSNDMKPLQKSVCTGLPTYAQLFEPSMTSDITPDPCTVNASTTEEHRPIECIDFEQEIVQEANQEKEAENINLLLKELKELKEKNTQLVNKNLQLQAELKEKSNKIEDMEQYIRNSGEKTAADILSTIFTPTKVKKIISSNKNRIK